MRDEKMLIVGAVFMALFLLTVAAIFTPLKSIFSPFVTCGALCYFLSPFVRGLERLKIRRMCATVIVYLSLLLFFCAAVICLLPRIISAAGEMGARAEAILREFEMDFSLPEISAEGAGAMLGAGKEMLGKCAGFFVGAAASFYLLAKPGGVQKMYEETVPRDFDRSVKILINDVKQPFDAFFKGQLLIALILSAMDGMFLYFVGIPYAFLLGLIGGLLDIIPYFGAAAALAIMVITALFAAPQKVIVVIIGFFVIQQIENNIISPKISGNSVKLNPAVVILSVYLGSYGGFWGILFAVPLVGAFVKISYRLLHAAVRKNVDERTNLE